MTPGKVRKLIRRHSSIPHDWWPLIRGYHTMINVSTTGSPVRLAVHSAGSDACRSSVFIGGGQTFKFFFDAPPRKPLLWACLLARASRDLYPARLWFARALIPHPICSGRDTGLSRCTNRNLAVISQSEFFFSIPPTPPPDTPLHFIPLYPTAPATPLFSTSLDIITEALCRCSSFFCHSPHFREGSKNVIMHKERKRQKIFFFPNY